MAPGIPFDAPLNLSSSSISEVGPDETAAEQPGRSMKGEVPMIMMPDDPTYKKYMSNIRKNMAMAKEEYVSDFDKKYPPDEYGEEILDGARVWNVYRGEVTEQDKELMDGWNKTLDILLIFAGLFSAVATAFIIESYKQLQPDWDEIAGRILLANAVAQSSGVNVTLPPGLMTNPDNFRANLTSRWINGMWLCSLTLSLVVALACILVKQWIVQYESRNAERVASTREWAHRHTLYAGGIKRWHMREIVDALPALLHASLLLFFGGMTVFFWSLDVGISVCLLVILICVAGFYGSTLLLSWWHITCPFYLPWFKHIHAAFDRVLRLCHIAIDKHRSLIHQLRTSPSAHDANVLTWLIAVSPIQEVNAVGLHAIGACVPTSQILTVLHSIRDREFWSSIESQLSTMFDSGHSEMVLYTLTHKELPTWTALNEEAPLPARAYDYLRTCHAIATLTELHSRAPGLAFVTSRADGTLRMPLLDTVCRRTDDSRYGPRRWLDVSQSPDDLDRRREWSGQAELERSRRTRPAGFGASVPN
ncbi:hypothetical protein EXIGLDRAFT_401620 [Exidia glandulosa HHB12029]|uniref:DUF6535 domain-containing protein n=1 Tax=Exidia glandulosa HHB12029 TaxID=1314781 RepID=A0A165ZAE2_EXIGL|nr:hypothetical protein EXIGLDRAFT_401620 [Exidia glandulosa HHB12029]